MYDTNYFIDEGRITYDSFDRGHGIRDSDISPANGQRRNELDQIAPSITTPSNADYYSGHRIHIRPYCAGIENRQYLVNVGWI
jgi:hypothetical protein